MTATAELSDYILPPTLQYERPDLPMFIYEPLLFPEPFTRYTPAIASQPPDSELRDDWYYFWGLGKRLGLQLEYWGQALDMTTAPATGDLLRIAAQHCPVPLEEIARHPHGLVLEGPPVLVEPGDPDSPHRFTTMPADVAAELSAALAGQHMAPGYSYRLTARRERDALNSACRDLPAIRRRLPGNPAWMNPDDMCAEHLQEGDRVVVESPWGQLETVARQDANLRRGVLSITHGFGGLPGRVDPQREGVSVNLLTSSVSDRQSINAMPRMSALPVKVRKLD